MIDWIDGILAMLMAMTMTLGVVGLPAFAVALLTEGP